jgi:protein O-GlcNAc transferase
MAVSQNKLNSSLPLLKSALEANPKEEQFWFSYLDALIRAEKLEHAESIFEQLKKSFPNGKHTKNLGAELSTLRGKADSLNTKSPPQKSLDLLLQYFQEGRSADAEKLALSLTVAFPKHPFGWKILGAILGRAGRLIDAVDANRTAIALNPNDAEIHNNQGNRLRELGRLRESEICLNKAIALKPDFAEAYSNLGNTFQNAGDLKRSEASYQHALAIRPDYAKAHHNLSATLVALNKLPEAEASSARAILLNSDYADAYVNMGIILAKLGRLDEAEEAYERALRLEVKAETLCNLGSTLKELGKLEEAEAAYKKAIALKEDCFAAHSNLLFLQGSCNFDPVQYLKNARIFSEAAHKIVPIQFTKWSCAKTAECLRIGFVSGDFKSHPVGFFIQGLLRHLNSSSMQLCAYSTVGFSDDTTELLKPIFHEWVSICGMSDEDAANRIHADNVHILIDLSGHTAHNRLPIFAWKPAPIQVSWLGYFASTGLSEIDYFIGDPFVTPRNDANHFVERVYALPETYLSFSPPSENLAVASLPAKKNGYITFGCLNNLAKMTPEVIAVRARILLACPESKLYLKDRQLDHKAARDRVVSQFSAYGISADRLRLEGRSGRTEYLKCFDQIDIALSPFPYGGGTTSVEGLWMGVPVISKVGNHFLSRLGESIAHNSYLTDWIASDDNEYVAKAVAFSRDLAELELLRASLRDRISTAPLFDTQKFAQHFENALKEMWRTFARGNDYMQPRDAEQATDEAHYRNLPEEVT